MNNVRTDNSYFETKVKLRTENLPHGRVNVLDMFAGGGRIWKMIKHNLSKRHIDVLRIEQKPDSGGVYLLGDNQKFLSVLDIPKFNVIDLDAYGVPYSQLEAILDGKPARGTVIFVTFIQSLYGRLPQGLLGKIGYSKAMLKKCPAIFNRRGLEKFRWYLAARGVEKIKRYSDPSGRKHYLCFTIE